MKVAILGTGPSAAYVAMACDALGVKTEIISKSSPANFYPGAFWPRLNASENDMPLKKVYISKVGDVLRYLKKQWGMVDEAWLEETSFPKESRTEFILNPYELFGNFWKDRDIMLVDYSSDWQVANLAKTFDHVFMTFPTEKSKIACDSFVVKYPIVSYPTDSNMAYCIYDGENYDEIVRMSCLFGFIHNEYSKDYIPSVELIGAEGKVSWVSDLMPNTSEWDPEDVPAKNVTLVGRLAQWSRKVLSHHAYSQTIQLLEEKYGIV